MTRVKLCGNTSIEDIKQAVRLGADAVGFITEVPVDTKRKISLDKASELIKEVPIFVDSVLVIMPNSAIHAIQMIEIAKPNIVQIHNDLEFKEMCFLRKSIDIPIIQKFSIPYMSNNNNNNNNISDKLIKLIKVYTESNLIDSILLDSKIKDMVGGTGITHDWKISKEIQEEITVPTILAGGINHRNVKDAIEFVKPFAVDVASGIETNGKKDGEKILKFIQATRDI